MGCRKLSYYNSETALSKNRKFFARGLEKTAGGSKKCKDYYAFGALMPSRNYSSSSYRFGFNGKEKDDEVSGTGNQYDYGFRIYNPRIGRFLSVDPLTSSYPWYTPYQFAGNKPIWAIDLDGLEEYYTSEGQLIGKYGKNLEIRIVYDNYVKGAKQLVNNPQKPGAEIANNIIYNRGSAGTFQSTDEAAEDWGARFNRTSINDNREYQSGIFFTRTNTGKGLLSYDEPKRGTESRAAPFSFTETKNRKLIGLVHSHGAYSPKFLSNIFSESYTDDNGNYVTGDKGTYRALERIGYVVTPNGSLLRFIPLNDQTDVLNRYMPSDSNDPETDPDIEVCEKPEVTIINNKE